MDKNELNRATKNLELFDCIFIDLFDTLIQRKHSPRYALIIYADYLIKTFHLDVKLDNLANSLTYFFACNKKETNNIENIYYHYHIDQYVSIDYFLNESYSVMLNAECNNVEKAHNVDLLISNYSKQKKTIIIISDFYFGKKYLTSILDKVFNGYIFYSDIISSSDIGYTKVEDEYYHFLEKKYDIRKALFIDDNMYISLFQKKKGLTYIHINASLNYAKYNKYNSKYNIYSYKFLKDISINNKDKYSCNYIYFVFHFLKKLFCELDDGSEIFFLAREGQFLKKCFDYFLLNNNTKRIKTHYLNVSRLSLMLLSGERKTNFAKYTSNIIQKLFPKNDISLSELIKCFGFEEKDVNYYIKSFQLDATTINKENVYPILSLLWSNDEFKNKCEKNRILAINKLRRLLVQKNKKLIVVDLGWHGTMQNCLKNIVSCDYTVIGYYLGTFVPTYSEKKSYIKGLLFDYNNHDFYYKNYDETICLEALLRADHGQIVSYNRSINFEMNDDYSLDVYNNYSKERQMIMMNLYKSIVEFDASQPVAFDTLYALEKDIINNKPFYTRNLDYYYSIKHVYGKTQSLNYFLSKNALLSRKTKYSIWLDKHPILNHFIRKRIYKI